MMVNAIVTIQVEDTDNIYTVELNKFLKELGITNEELQVAVRKVLK